jgi:hypothetical protein
MKKVDISNKCKCILNNYDISTCVNNSDYIFLISVFKMHEDWIFKNGDGIKSIEVALSFYSTRYFKINRVDGTSTDISYKKCLNKPTKLSKIKKACRTSIYPIVKTFREKNVIFGVSTCPITGEVLTSTNTHIDHYDLKFCEMFDIWINDKDIDYVYSKLSISIDNSFSGKIECKILELEFINFHNANCNLRAVSEYANTMILK